MFTEAIVVAIITGTFTVIGQMVIAKKQRQEADVKQALRDQRVDMQLETINHKLDIHNGYAEKFGEIQNSITEIKTKMHVLHPD